MLYYLALGSNLGDRGENIRKTISYLRTIGEIVHISSVYETEPVDMDGEGPWFFNLVLSFHCGLDPHHLLDLLKAHEVDMKRVPVAGSNLPRTMDIDILLADDMVIHSDGLTVPHPRMTQRAFVMVPLVEISPDLIHPVLKQRVGDIARSRSYETKVFKVDGVLKNPHSKNL